MDDLRGQLDRNLMAMASELARDPGADQREWEAMAGDVFGFEVTKIVTSGTKNWHRFPSTESKPYKNCHLPVTQNVTRCDADSRNPAN